MSETNPDPARKWPLLVSAAVIAGLILTYFLSPGARDFAQQAWEALQSGEYDRVSRWFDELGWMGPLVIILLMVVQMFLIVLPSWGLMIISVIAYGPFWGAVTAVVAVGVASSIGYVLGRAFGRAALEKLAGKNEGVQRFIERYGFGAVFLFRISPLLSSDAISLIAGVLHMEFGRFMAATLLGITPLAAAIAYFGSEADKMKTGLYWLGGIGLALYAAFIWWDWRRKKKAEGGPPS